MAYDSTTGIISVETNSGISIYDIQRGLGVSSYNDIGGIIMYATAHDMVNVWAKYKPIRSNKLGVLTEAERQEELHGLDIPVCTHTSTLADFLDDYPNGYSYLWPRGIRNTSINPTAINEWFRFLDFDGYNSNANCFVNSNDILFPSSYIVGAGGVGVYFQLGINRGTSLRSGSIGITDLKYGTGSFGDLYFGLIFVTGSTYKIITSGQSLSDDVDDYGHGEVFIEESNNVLDGLTTNTEYDVYPVLSLMSHTSMSSYAQTDEVLALPISPFTFQAAPLVTQQNVSILSCGASTNAGVLLVDFVISMSAQGGAPTSMTAAYEIYEASSSGDMTGSQISGMSGTVQLSTSQNQNIQKSRRMTSPLWVRVYVYNQNNSSVYTNRWAQVRTGGDLDPLGPTPVD